MFRSTRITRFRFRQAVATVAVALVVGACGSSATPAPTPTPTPPPDAKAMLAKSATSLTELKSFRLQITIAGTIQVPGSASASPSPVVLDGTSFTADVDVAGQKGKVALVIPPALLTQIMASSGAPSLGTVPSGDTADLIINGDIYAKVPLLASVLGSDKWIKISAASLQAMTQQYSGLLSSIPSTAPAPSASPDLSMITSLLQSTGITLTSQGTDACADGTCNKTLITIPASALKQLATMAESSSPSLGSSAPDLSALDNLGPTTVTIWTGASNDRFNKLELAVDAGSASKLTLDVILSNFDVAVDATPPPADQVTSLPGL